MTRNYSPLTSSILIMRCSISSGKIWLEKKKIYHNRKLYEQLHMTLYIFRKALTGIDLANLYIDFGNISGPFFKKVFYFKELLIFYRFIRLEIR